MYRMMCNHSSWRCQNSWFFGCLKSQQNMCISRYLLEQFNTLPCWVTFCISKLGISTSPGILRPSQPVLVLILHQSIHKLWVYTSPDLKQFHDHSTTKLKQIIPWLKFPLCVIKSAISRSMTIFFLKHKIESNIFFNFLSKISRHLARVATCEIWLDQGIKKKQKQTNKK